MGNTNPEEMHKRLARTRALAEVGQAGLDTLLSKRALVVGCGGLGQPVAMYLAGAGLGHLTLVDDDDVEESNLNRQVFFGVMDVGRPKVEVLQQRLRATQPHVAVAAMELRLTSRNARGIIMAHQVVVDCTDDPDTKFILHDTALALGVPLVHGGAVRWGGQVTVVAPGGRPCLRCLFDGPPPAERCQDAGVLGAACGAVAGVMAAEAVKVLLGVGQPLQSRMLTLDLLAGQARAQPLYPRPDCPSCASAPARRVT